jgi:hypothetical protein
MPAVFVSYIQNLFIIPVAQPKQFVIATIDVHQAD